MCASRNLIWGSNLPESWGWLYGQLVADLTGENPEVVVEDAKEKFGRLRVDLDRTSPALRALIDAAERASVTTCERCGADAALVKSPDGVFGTLCSNHRGDAQPAEDPILMTITVVADRGASDEPDE